MKTPKRTSDERDLHPVQGERETTAAAADRQEAAAAVTDEAARAKLREVLREAGPAGESPAIPAETRERARSVACRAAESMAEVQGLMQQQPGGREKAGALSGPATAEVAEATVQEFSRLMQKHPEYARLGTLFLLQKEGDGPHPILASRSAFQLWETLCTADSRAADEVRELMLNDTAANAYLRLKLLEGMAAALMSGPGWGIENLDILEQVERLCELLTRRLESVLQTRQLLRRPGPLNARDVRINAAAHHQQINVQAGRGGESPEE